MHGQYEKLFDKGPSKISPFFIPMMIGNMAAGHVSIAFGLKGPSSCVVTACATGTNNIGDAFKVIQRGDADVMVAGGTEASISGAAVAGFCSMKALCTDHNDDPEHASRPFDANRSGFIMGEGAGPQMPLHQIEHRFALGRQQIFFPAADADLRDHPGIDQLAEILRKLKIPEPVVDHDDLQQILLPDRDGQQTETIEDQTLDILRLTHIALLHGPHLLMITMQFIIP